MSNFVYYILFYLILILVFYLIEQGSVPVLQFWIFYLQILSLLSMVGASATALSVVALNLALENNSDTAVKKVEIRDVAKMAGISKAKYGNFYRWVVGTKWHISLEKKFIWNVLYTW